MELAIRGYMREPAEPAPENWPPAFDPGFAAPLTATLRQIVTACLDFAQEGQA
jgi:formiminoglutamase